MILFQLNFTKSFPFQINALDNVGQIALHRAAQNGHVNICKTLLQNGADASVSSLQGYTAAQIGTEAVQKILQGKLIFSEYIFIEHCEWKKKDTGSLLLKILPIIIQTII